jgi:DNA-binding CsgD family transcriptional regulator/tetratricopeptide (TPR) repeat protein
MAPFVGRREELGSLEAIAVAAGEGHTAAALVVGDPGTGKTRLLAEAERALDVNRRFHVVGYEAEQAVPLAAAAGLLRELEAVGNSIMADLVYGVPDSSGLEPVRIFEAAHRALADLVPAVLVIDDLQWTDGLSRALVHYIVRGAEMEERQLVVLVATRPGSLATAFADSLAHAIPAERLRVLELRPLARDEGVELAMALAPDLDERRAVEIWERARGVPFWLETLATSRENLTDVGRVVAGRLRGASADSAVAFALLVVAARPLPRNAIAEIQYWSADRTDTALAELVSHGVVSPPTTVVEPVHDLVREAALAGLPMETKRSCHQHLATWLEGQGDDVQILREAIEHRLNGGMPVLEPLERLVSHPRRRVLGRDGLRWMLEIADREDPGRESVTLHAALATLGAELGESQLAQERWAVVVDHSSDRPVRAKAALEAARAAYLADRPGEARTYLERARSLSDDRVLGIEIDAQEATVRRFLEFDVEGAKALEERALVGASALLQAAEGVDALGEASRLAVHDALTAARDAAMMADDPEAGLEIGDRLVEVANGLGEERRLRALVSRAWMLRQAGRLSKAEEEMGSALAEAQMRILPRLEVEAGFSLASARLALGRLEDAEHDAIEAVELAERGVDLSRMIATPTRVRLVSLVVQLSRGDWRQAVGRIRDLLSEESPHYRLVLHQTIGVWLARAAPEESREEVAKRFAAAQADADAAWCRRCRGEVDLRAAEGLARVGLVDDALAIARDWDASHPSPGPLNDFWRRRAESMIAASCGEASYACDLLEALDVRAAQLDLRLEQLWVWLDHGAAAASFDRQRAVEMLRGAAELAGRLGARNERALAQRRLRSLGVRTWRRGARGAELTERELEIARFVATGASNPEIAQTLFLSRKTVERHVSNILRKLRVRNRAELASRLEDVVRQAEGGHR